MSSAPLALQRCVIFLLSCTWLPCISFRFGPGISYLHTPLPPGQQQARSFECLVSVQRCGEGHGGVGEG